MPYTPAEEQTINLLPKALQDLMKANMVHPNEIQEAVGKKGYFPKDMPVNTYPQDFIHGCLIGAWPSVMNMIQEERELPF